MICLHVGNFKPQNYLLHRNHKKVSKINYATLVVYSSEEDAISFHLLYSIECEGKIFNTSIKLMCSDFWWFLMNVISKYLFLEQFCQFSEGVLKFLSEAGDSIHSFSSCTHIGALKTKWKFRISLKSAYLYTSNVRVCRKKRYEEQCKLSITLSY